MRRKRRTHRKKVVHARRHVRRRTRRNPTVYSSAPVRRRRRRHVVSKSYRRRVRRNPSRVKAGNIDITKILIDGGLAGGGAVVCLWLSNKVNSILDKYTGGQQIARNVIALGLSLAGSYAAHQFLDKEKAEAVSCGMVAGVVLLAIKSSFGAQLGLAGNIQQESYMEPLNEYTLGYQYPRDHASSLGLLAGNMQAGLGLLAGQLSEQEYNEMSDYM